MGLERLSLILFYLQLVVLTVRRRGAASLEVKLLSSWSQQRSQLFGLYILPWKLINLRDIACVPFVS